MSDIAFGFGRLGAACAWTQSGQVIVSVKLSELMHWIVAFRQLREEASFEHQLQPVPHVHHVAAFHTRKKNSVIFGTVVLLSFGPMAFVSQTNFAPFAVQVADFILAADTPAI